MEQKEIVNILGRLLEKEKRIKEAIEVVMNYVDTIKKVILSCEFRDELVTNDFIKKRGQDVKNTVKFLIGGII